MAINTGYGFIHIDRHIDRHIDKPSSQRASFMMAPRDAIPFLSVQGVQPLSAIGIRGAQ